MQIELTLAAARMRAASDFPYLATALWALIPVRKEGLGTLAVDKYWRLYYDPQAIEAWDVKLTSSVLVHEINHLLREHHQRADGMGAKTAEEHRMFNIAGDLEINDDLKGQRNIQLPDGVIYPATYGFKDNELMEQYYEKLQKMPKTTVTVKMPASGKAAPMAGNCGSCAHGGQSEWEEGAPGGENGKGDPTGQNGSKYDGVTDAEGELIRRSVAREIQEASKTRGTVPAGLERWANQKLKPKIDYKKVVRSAVRAGIEEIIGHKFHTYRRPSRRQSVMPRIIMPSMTSPLPQIGVVIDTSGSMSDNMISQAVAEVGGLLKALGYAKNVHVVSCDAAAGPVQKVFRAGSIKLTGGGGTDIGVGMEALEKHKPKMDLMVIITDKYTPWPAHKPSAKVIIVSTAKGGQSPTWPHREIQIDCGAD